MQWKLVHPGRWVEQKYLRARRFIFALANKFSEDRTTTLAASLAFYAVLSLAPLAVLILFGFSRLDEQLVDRFILEANSLVGYSGGSAIELTIRSAQGRPMSGGVASLVSLVLVLFSASAMFAELRDSLCIVFRMARGPAKSAGFIHTGWRLLRDRLLSAAFALIFVFLLALSLVASAVLSALAEAVGVLHLELLISFALYSVAFTLLFMYGTPRGLGFSAAIRGGLFTSLLLMAGKTLIGLYIGASSAAGAYGAAGSLMALLLWMFCASLIMFTGAQAAWLLSPRGREYRNQSPIEPPRSMKEAG